MNIVRVCRISDEDPREPGSGKHLKGYNDVFVPIFEAYMTDANLTYHEADVMGLLQDPRTLRYDGCVGSMQLNLTDIAMVSMQMSDYGANISTQAVVMNDYNTVLSAYYAVNETEDSSSTRVLDFLEGYSSTHWLLTISLTTVISFLLVVGMTMPLVIRGRLRKKNVAKSLEDMSKIVVSCALNQHSNCGNVSMKSVPNCLYTFATLLGFFTAFFLTSMIKTEMVVMERPDTYDNYHELLDRDIVPIWIELVNDHRPFKEAKVGSAAKKLWERAVDRGLDQSLVKASLGKADKIVPLAMAVARRQAAGLNIRVVASFFTSNGCAFSRQSGIMTQANVYSRIDPNVDEFLRVQLSSSLMSEERQRQSRKGFMIAFEMATFLADVVRETQFIVSNTKGHYAEVESCMSGNVVMPDHVMTDVPLTHYWDLMSLCLLTVIGSVCILILERRMRRPRDHHESVRRKEITPRDAVGPPNRSIRRPSTR